MRIGRLSSVGAMALAVGCSSGGGGTGTPASLAGQWMVWLTVDNQEMGPYATCFSQTGNTVDGVGLTGTVNGNSFTVTNQDLGGLQVVFAGTTSGNTASGTLSITGSSVTGTFRMQAFAPVGSVTMSGNVAGQAIALSSTTAAGRREYADQAHTQLTDLEVSNDDGVVRVHLTFGAAGFGVGTLAAGAGGIQVDLSHEVDGSAVEESATGGTITVSRYDANGMAGTYTLQFAGGTLTGSFDVAWDLEAYEPP